MKHYHIAVNAEYPSFCFVVSHINVIISSGNKIDTKVHMMEHIYWTQVGISTQYLVLTINDTLAFQVCSHLVNMSNMQCYTGIQGLNNEYSRVGPPTNLTQNTLTKYYKQCTEVKMFQMEEELSLFFCYTCISQLISINNKNIQDPYNLIPLLCNGLKSVQKLSENIGI
jgi:hypothetical protein